MGATAARFLRVTVLLPDGTSMGVNSSGFFTPSGNLSSGSVPEAGTSLSSGP